MKNFLKININYVIYLLFSIVIELFTVYIIDNTFFISKPYFYICTLGVIFGIYNLIYSKIGKNIFLMACLFVQCFFDLLCVVLIENTGTLFDYNMVYLIREGIACSSTIEFNYLYIGVVSSLLLIFIVLIIVILKTSIFNRKKIFPLTAVLSISLSLIGRTIIVTKQDTITQESFYDTLYTSSNDKYAEIGTSSEVINELYKLAFFKNSKQISEEEIDAYIYEETNEQSEYNGVSKDNNVVTILVESFEWYSFISDSETYPNGLNLSSAELDKLFPNLRKFYNQSTIMNNHYSRDKTDINEDQAILGSYPNNNYISYSFQNNSMINSVVSNIKLEDQDVETLYFHSNSEDFYNRKDVIKSLGYDEIYFIDDMEEYGVTNNMEKSWKDSLNADSVMFDKMKEVMFPTDKRFVTQITTLSMHGNYVTRSNMKEYLKKLDDNNIVIENDYLKNYIAAVMDLDKAIGIMMDYLEKNNLLECTTILMYADHNTYLDNLSNYVKDIDDYSSDNYTELYRLPFMIYDSNIGHQIINKFTCTFDIAPTIMDLLGINYYSNLYYGNSVFVDETSILYSKSNDIFMTDKLYFSDINNLLYKNESVTDDEIKEVEEKALKLLKKIFYTNHIFLYDYFSNEENGDKYIENMRLLNN